MPYRICKTFEIESGHQLSKHPDKCRFPHGHSRTVEFVLEADTLDDHDMVCDFKRIRELIGDFVERFDHALCVNTDDPGYAALKSAYGERVIGFESRDPTTEVLAREFHDRLAAALREASHESGARYPIRDCVRLVRCRVWETRSSWAEYSAE